MYFDIFWQIFKSIVFPLLGKDKMICDLDEPMVLIYHIPLSLP